MWKSSITDEILESVIRDCDPKKTKGAQWEPMATDSLYQLAYELLRFRKANSSTAAQGCSSSDIQGAIDCGALSAPTEEQRKRYIDDDFLAEIMDDRYSSHWVGCAIRWQLSAAPQASTGNGNAQDPLANAGVPGPADAAPVSPQQESKP